ncbi:MAG: hypothetical protein HOP96_10605 [Sphingomonas sp.]|nr:hypothetical protein [Sphingomonas sp.]
MSGRSFRSVFMVASCAGAALACYLVSLNVASERASLEDVENRIVLAQRDIRLLQTEIGTRGRLAQLERWNVKVIQLSAPTADQFLEGGFQLARLGRPEQKTVDAPVVFASAPAPSSPSAPLEEGERPDNGAGVTPSAGPAQLVHQASLKLPPRVQVPVKATPEPPKTVAEKKVAAPAKVVADKVSKTVSDKPVKLASLTTKPTPAPVKKAGDNKAKADAKPVTKPVRTAKVDPLAPLPKPKDSAKAR